MKHFIRFAAFTMLVFCLQSCFTKKQLIDTLVNAFGIDKICFSEPLDYSFDPNNPNMIRVKVSLSNGNNYDVTGSLDIEILIRDKNNTVIGASGFITPIVLFPKNQTNAYTTPFIDIVTLPLKPGEKYIIDARKYVSGASYSVSYNPFFSSCYLYHYPITLK